MISIYDRDFKRNFNYLSNKLIFNKLCFVLKHFLGLDCI